MQNHGQLLGKRAAGRQIGERGHQATETGNDASGRSGLTRLKLTKDLINVSGRLKAGGHKTVFPGKLEAAESEAVAFDDGEFKFEGGVDVLIDDQVKWLGAEAVSGKSHGDFFGEDTGVPEPGLMARGDDGRGGIGWRGKAQACGVLIGEVEDSFAIGRSGTREGPVFQARLGESLHDCLADPFMG